jgi:predicted ATPase/DNA-binding XRE family transcriptional regulator
VDNGSFAEHLRRLREAVGLSQEELAERAGLSSHAVSALERGTRTRPYPHTVRALADALGAGPTERAALVAAVPRRSRAARPPADVPATGRGRRLLEPTTPLRGRERELADLVALVREQRLVTLTGLGGVGKTRLGLAVATAAAPHFADGVAHVELAPVLDPGAVLPAIADALDVEPGPAPDPVAAVFDRLRDREVLLLLDNLEHLLDAAPDVAAVVEAAPGLSVLATSRAPLRVRGEREVAVEPLAVPTGPDDVATSPAAELLLERARAVQPAWGTAPGDAEAVTTICTRLEGIPLALELAAARARLLGPRALVGRLDDALTEGSRDLPERQRTMRATLDWSHGLLDEDARGLLRLLSVFVGGFRLDDVEGVVQQYAAARPAAVLGLLEHLAEHSFVASDPATGRHRLLEPVAQYAHQRLVEAGEQERALRAHAAHFLAVAEETAPSFQRADQVVGLARMDAEHPNTMAAMERSLAAGDAVTAARFGWSLWMYWWLRGHHRPGRRLTEQALAHELPDDVRARAELAAATMAFSMDDIPASRAWWSAAADRTADGGDPVAHANAVAGLGLAELASGELDAARECFLRATPFAEAGGPDGEWTAALAQVWLGTVALLVGEADRAVEHIARGLASARRRGDRLTAYVALFNLSQLELQRGRLAAARAHLAEGMRLTQETGDQSNLAYLLDAQAVLEAADDGHSRVPLLLGAAQSIREAVGARGYGYYRPDPQAIAAAAAEARGLLGDDRFDDALDTGRGLGPDEAVILVLGGRAH